jgi:hypothetical protein
MIHPFIISNLISKLKDYETTKSIADGAWSYINNNLRSEYARSIYSRDWSKLSAFLQDPLNIRSAYGLITPIDSKQKDRLLRNDFSADLVLYGELYGYNALEDLKHAECLNHTWSSETKTLMTYPDSPRHAHFAHQIIEIAPKGKIGVEIGGGYGGMIYFLKKFGFENKLINCDLLETLLLAYVFLSFNKIKVEICFSREDLSLAMTANEIEVVLITPNLFAELKEVGEIGFIFNSRSLSEMSQTQSKQYLLDINNILCPKYFISENAEELRFPNSIRHIEIIQDELEILLSNYKIISYAKTKFMGGSNRYGTRVYEFNSLELDLKNF